MENTVKDIYSEVYAILNMLGKEYINKLPKDIYNIIKEEKSTEYNPVYETTVALDKQDVKKETISIIAFLHLNYWCNEEEKIKLRELFESDYLWATRVAIVSTIYYIKRGDYQLILEFAQKTMQHPHHLIHKATGWMLREVGKKDKKVLKEFLLVHKSEMPSIMKNYANEKLKIKL